MKLKIETIQPEGGPRSKWRRFAAVALPAGVVTGALFVAMQNLVEVDDFEPPEMTAYDVLAYVPITNPPPPPKPDREFRRFDPVDPPPLPPPLVKNVDAVSVPNPGYSGAAPADYGEVDLEQLAPMRATSVMDRTMTPLAPPSPVYPRHAAAMGLEGDCLVYLNVSRRGMPFQVRAECSDPIFERAARKAVQNVKFAPKIHDGLPITVTGVVYPLEFRLEP